MTVFEKYYSSYKNTIQGFNDFHNEVINMPRDQFSDAGLQKVRVLAGYLLLTEGFIKADGDSYKVFMHIIHEQLITGNFPQYRDLILEKRYFEYDNLDVQYDTEGRMFRHLMSLCAFFGFISSLAKQRKIIDYGKCREYYYSDDKVLMPVARNNVMMLNAKDNDFINSLKGITIDKDTEYRPAYGILRYIHDIKRPATKFEISVLLGRIDTVKKEADILRRALEIGAILPKTQDEQIPYFFSNMGWKYTNGTHFSYAASQEPHFKFNSFLLFLNAFGLIEYNSVTETYTNTDYANKLIEDDVSYLIADLEELLKTVDNYDAENKQLNDLILYQRNPELLRLAREDTNFIIKMNKRSIANPIYDTKGKKQRNRLIAELAKIQVDYICQYANRHIFKMPNGKYYCEAHHILEFSTEDGPDITNNLVVLGPEAHMIIHHACKEEVDNTFLQLRINSALDFNRFKEMITVYNCLTPSQIEILSNRRVITANEKNELLDLLSVG